MFDLQWDGQCLFLYHVWKKEFCAFLTAKNVRFKLVKLNSLFISADS